MTVNGNQETMTQITSSSDKKIIQYLQNICKFHYILEDEICTEISFYDQNDLFEGTIRKHPDKYKIISMIAKFKNLKKLNLRKCKINNLPDIHSKNLEFIDISSNDIEQIPNWIIKQPLLKYLNIGSNKITTIPDLQHLPLEILKIHKNSISNMPKIPNTIKSLNLYLNNMKEIPENILNLSLLEVFSFGVTEMKQLPPLHLLTNLKWLTLTVNQIENISEDICKLKNLEGLQLAKNKLKTLPEMIGNMNIKTLTLYSNEISKLPQSFFNLKLNKLNLEMNQLTEEDKEKIYKNFQKIDFLRI